ncbi:UNVERIFIED_CONTAM: hypothetical protein FKN15_053922 [Acipenser sinensis]
MVQSENSSAASGSTPNPSILLALRLASHHDSDTERGMLARLQVDAVKRVQEGLPFSSGTVALYCLAMQASCADPSLTPAPGLKGGKKALDLRKLLEKKLKEEIDNIGESERRGEERGRKGERREMRDERGKRGERGERRGDGRGERGEGIDSKNVPLTNYYQVSLDILAQCMLGKPVTSHSVQSLIEASDNGGFSYGEKYSVDTASVAVLALTCVKRSIKAPDRMVLRLKILNALKCLIKNILQETTSDGLIGNLYSTGLAMQALSVTSTNYDCSRTIQTLLERAGRIDREPLQHGTGHAGEREEREREKRRMNCIRVTMAITAALCISSGMPAISWTMASLRSGIVRGFPRYTRDSRYPHNQKSTGVRCSERGGHSQGKGNDSVLKVLLQDAFHLVISMRRGPILHEDGSVYHISLLQHRTDMGCQHGLVSCSSDCAETLDGSVLPLALPTAPEGLITVHYRVEDGIHYSFNDSIEVTVPVGSSLLQGDYGQVHRFCGTDTTIPDFYTYGRTVMVTYKSDHYLVENGFSVTYEIAVSLGIPQTRPPERPTKPDLMGRAVSQGPPLSHSERGKAHTPSSPPLRVIAMTDRWIPRDCCPLPAVIRMCQTGRWKSVSSEGGGDMAPKLSDPDGKRRGIRGLEERMRLLTSGSWVSHTGELYTVSVAPPLYTVSLAPPLYTVSLAPPLYTVSLAPALYTVSLAPPLYTVSLAPPLYTVSLAPPLYTVSLAPALYTVSLAPPLYTVSLAPPLYTLSLAPLYTESLVPPLYTVSLAPPLYTVSLAPALYTVSLAPPLYTVYVAPPLYTVSLAPLYTESLAPPLYTVSLTPPLYTVSLAPPLYTASLAPPLYTVSLAPPLYTVSLAPPLYTVSLAPPLYTVSLTPPLYTVSLAPPLYTVSLAPPLYTVSLAPLYTVSLAPLYTVSLAPPLSFSVLFFWVSVGCALALHTQHYLHGLVLFSVGGMEIR